MEGGGSAGLSPEAFILGGWEGEVGKRVIGEEESQGQFS